MEMQSIIMPLPAQIQMANFCFTKQDQKIFVLSFFLQNFPFNGISDLSLKEAKYTILVF
jgi:hypothetical protein